MLKIHEYLRLRKQTGDIGVEIEVEGHHLPDETELWSRERDGSLRGAENGEYVLRKPVLHAELGAAFDQLRYAFEESGAVVDQSTRAGVHVHINVQQLTFIQLFNYITLYLIFEEPILELCDRFRRGNHFCLRAKDAGYLPALLRNAALSEDVVLLNTEDIRYSAMNVTSVFKYGSVEFRSLESTDDFDHIQGWCDLLYTLKQAALTFKDPVEIMGVVSMGGYGRFAGEVLGPHLEKIIKQPEWEQGMRRGIRTAQDIAFSRKWGVKSLDIFQKNAGLL